MTSPAAGAEEVAGLDLSGSFCLSRNSSLLLAFLLKEDGLAFFFRTSALAEVVLSLAGGVFVCLFHVTM
jgi:hypothetical protein